MRTAYAAVIAFTLSSTAFAQAPKVKKVKPSAPAAEKSGDEGEKAEPAAKSSTAGMGESEANRQGKIAYVGAEAGLGMVFPATGIEAGYFLTPNLIPSISYIQSDFTVSTASVTMSLVTVRALWFIGNSFYADFGVGQRSIAFDFSLDAAAVGAGKYKVGASVANFGLDIGIGNRWQWDGFWLGTEWVGYFLPLAKSGDSTITAPAGADPADVKSAQDSLDSLGKTGNPQFLRLQLGWAF